MTSWRQSDVERASLHVLLCNRNSVRPSVCPSITLVIHAETVQYIEIRCAPYESGIFSFWGQSVHSPGVLELTMTLQAPVSKAIIWQICWNNWETVGDISLYYYSLIGRLSIGTKTDVLEWPWVAVITHYFTEYVSFRSQLRQIQSSQTHNAATKM